MRILLLFLAGCAAMAPDEALRYARENRRRGRLDKAAEFYEEAAERLEGEKREQTLLHAARTYHEAGLWRRSYRVYKTLFEETADQKVQKEALSRMFEIASAFVEGRSEPSWLGVNVGWREWGARNLAELAERFPCLPQAQRAWVLVGRYWLREGDYDEAERWFGKVLREAAAPEVRRSALFYLAECCIGRVRGVDYDMGLLEKARKYLRLYLAHGGAEAEKARERLGWVEEMLANHELKVARFYISQNVPKAALPHLQYLVSEFPDTDAAKTARDLILELSR